MTTTSPKHPEAEVQLAPAELERVLGEMKPGMVLVGGQAIAFWVDRFGIDTQGLPVSHDGDVLGSLEQATGIAKALNGILITPHKASLTSLTAQIRFPRSHGKYSNIDFLHLLFTTRGIHKSSEFTERVKNHSVNFELPNGAKFQVMHPFELLESRMYNALGLLDEKGPHVITQLRWAVMIMNCTFLALLHANAGTRASEADPKLAGLPDGSFEGRIGKMVEQVFELGKSGAGARVLKEHGIEVLASIPFNDIEAQAPAAKRQLDVVRDFVSSRQKKWLS